MACARLSISPRTTIFVLSSKRPGVFDKRLFYMGVISFSLGMFWGLCVGWVIWG